MRVELKPSVESTKVVKVEVRPALHADKCDACKRIFSMKEWCHEQHRARLRGTFDRSAQNEAGRSIGNMFSATVCSFLCAHKLFAESGWKELSEYAPFVQAGATLARAEVVLTAVLLTEEQLVQAWEEAPEANRILHGDVIATMSDFDHIV